MRRAVVERLDAALGGTARRHVIVAFACVLALDSADKATVGTSATQLQSALGIGTAGLGLLLTVSTLAGAIGTVPFGMLIDRVVRTRLLAIAVASWAVTMALSGFATDYVFLLAARSALGLLTAVAGPAIASLIGDYFPQGERGRVYGAVLSGELVGAGIGFLVAGQLAPVSWRAPFFALVPPSALVCWLVARLPEPARGGSAALASSGPEPAGTSGEAAEGSREPDRASVRTAVLEHRAQAREKSMLDRRPDTLSSLQAARYVLRVRTNLVLIVASALGYFFFAGVRGFAIELAKRQFSVSQRAATSLTLVLGIGALVGVLSGGRLADRLLGRGRIAARPETAGIAVLLAAGLMLPALLSSQLPVAVPLLTLAALCLGASNPPLDAARLDIIHPAVWGRAEAVRTVLRTLGDSAAPVTFGLLADSVFGGGTGLHYTFLVMLSALVAASLITLLIARRTYPGDVAAAAESVRRFGRSSRDPA